MSYLGNPYTAQNIIGMSSYGWICKREYARFYLWEKATRSGKTIKECFYKQEIPVFNYSINDN